MKFFFLLIYPVLSLSCIAMEVAEYPIEKPSKKVSSSLSQQNKRKRIDTPQDIHLKKTRPLEPSVLTAHLEERSNLLSAEINKALHALEIITKELGEKIPHAKELAMKNNNYKHLSELAGFVVNTRSLDSQAQLLLKNLTPIKGSNDEAVVNKSFAIIASSEFATRINQLIKALTENFDMKEINYENLKGASLEINNITADIDIRDKLIKLDKDK